MAIGSKMFAVTVPLAAFLGSATGVVLAPWATEQIRVRTGVALAAGPSPAPKLAMPAEMPPTPSRVLPGAVQPSSSAPDTRPPADEIELPPVPKPGRSPFDSFPTAQTPVDQSKPGAAPAPDGPPMADADDLIPIPEAELPLPADYFDIAKLASTKGDGTDPPVLKPGQYVMIEVLEALPGRPITGYRLIRPDGTVSLYFYGDLHVAGLNRNQIKVKVLERMNQFLTHNILGFEPYRDDKRVLVPAVESNRVFIDESINFEPHGNVPAPIPVFHPDPNSDLREQIKALSAKVEHLIGQEPKPK